MKILLMEDELHLRQNIKKFLSLKGYSVDEFENGDEVLKNANPNDYDCMILDINTPEINGFELLEYIRNTDVATPALFISALTDVKKVLKAFELGADDYLKKPFDLAELEVRVLKAANKNLADKEIVFDDRLKYDLKERALIKENTHYKLSTTQKKFLHMLVKNRNKLVTFDMLQDYVWDAKDISHSTIISTLRNLKKILPPSLIKNVKGEGYILEI